MALIATLAGCGSEREAGSDLSGTLEIWGGTSDDAILQRLATRVAELSDVELVVRTFTFNVPGQLTAAARSNELPDLVIGTPWYMHEFVAKGHAVPVELPARRQFSPAATAAVSSRGKAYAVPICADSVALIRNTDLVPQAPTTMEQLVEESRHLQDTGRIDMPLVTSTSEDAGPATYLYPLYTAGGGYLYGPKADGRYDTADVGVDSPGGVAALGKLAELGRAAVLRTGMSYVDARKAFATGRVPFLIDNAGALAEKTVAGAAVTPVPGFAGGSQAKPFVKTDAVYVLNTDRNKLATSFVQQLLLGRNLLDTLYDTTVGCTPASGTVTKTDALSTEQLAGFRAAAAAGVPEPVNIEWTPAATPFAEALRAAIEGSGTPQAVAATAAQKIRAALPK